MDSSHIASFRREVIALHNLLSDFPRKLPDITLPATAALELFQDSLGKCRESLRKYQISQLPASFRGDIKAVASLLTNESTELHARLSARMKLEDECRKDIVLMEAELQVIESKLQAGTPRTPENVETSTQKQLEAQKLRVVAKKVEKETLVATCRAEAAVLRQVTRTLQEITRAIDADDQEKIIADRKEGTAKWRGEPWTRNPKIVGAIIIRDILLSPLRFTLSVFRMGGTACRSTWANVLLAFSRRSVFRSCLGVSLAVAGGAVMLGLGICYAFWRSLKRVGAACVALKDHIRNPNDSYWVRQVDQEKKRDFIGFEITKGLMGGIMPSIHTITGEGEELASCLEAENEWMDDFWMKWDSWLENMLNTLGPSSDELRQQNLGKDRFEL